MIPDWAKEMNCAVTVCDKEGAIIAKLLETGGTKSYTIQKNGQKKMIYQPTGKAFLRWEYTDMSIRKRPTKWM